MATNCDACGSKSNEVKAGGMFCYVFRELFMMSTN